MLDYKSEIKNKGVWITCFSESKIFYSTSAIDNLINTCQNLKLNEIHLQIYRAGQAYYDSKFSDRTKYDEILKISAKDTIDYLLKEAARNNIKVFAWINVLSLGQNKNADIVTIYGESVLTKDQYLRSSQRAENTNETDKYYLRDNQIFLEPGDSRVGEFIIRIIDEIITRYPSFSGIHLDYIRYPYPVPSIPDSRFIKYGVSYGYGENSIRVFKEKTGLDALSIGENRNDILLWDNWKRAQVTNLVKKISEYVKNKSAHMLVSCAVVPSAWLAYSAAFQDWSLWLKEGVVDYVVLMNYTKDIRLTENIVKSALSYRGKGSVFIGVGAFLMKDSPELLTEQCNILETLKPDGIVFFSYDDLIK